LTDFETLIKTVKKNCTVFHTGYMYRYNPAVIKLIQDIKGGKLGEIYSVEAHMNCMHKPEKREWLKKYKGGMMFFLGCHLIDLILRIQGRPEEILPLNCSTGTDGVTSEDFGMAVLKYKNGVSFAKTCAAEAGGFMRRQLVVCGSKGTVQLMPLEGYTNSDNIYTDVREVSDDQFNWRNDGIQYRTDEGDRYDAMMRSFAEYAAGKKENPYSYEYELELYRTVLKCCGQ
jgi:predicted dehydrogenase